MSESGLFQNNWFYKAVAYSLLAVVIVTVACMVLGCLAAFLIVAGVAWLSHKLAVKSMALVLFLMTAFEQGTPLYNQVIGCISVLLIVGSVLLFFAVLFGPMIWVFKLVV